MLDFLVIIADRFEPLYHDLKFACVVLQYQQPTIWNSVQTSEYVHAERVSCSPYAVYFRRHPRPEEP